MRVTDGRLVAAAAAAGGRRAEPTAHRVRPGTRASFGPAVASGLAQHRSLTQSALLAGGAQCMASPFVAGRRTSAGGGKRAGSNVGRRDAMGASNERAGSSGVRTSRRVRTGRDAERDAQPLPTSHAQITHSTGTHPGRNLCRSFQGHSRQPARARSGSQLCNLNPRA